MDVLYTLESTFVSFSYLLVFFAAFFESIILLGFLLPGGLIVKTQAGLILPHKYLSLVI